MALVVGAVFNGGVMGSRASAMFFDGDIIESDNVSGHQW